jgi:small-conductance mechanosensitive channel
MRWTKLLIILMVLSFSLSNSVYAQDSIVRKKTDTTSKPLREDSTVNERIQQAATSLNIKLRERYRGQLAFSRQERIFASLRAVFLRTRDFLKTGIDTFNISNELSLEEKRIEIASEGIFTNVGSIQTSRNLATSSILLSEIYAHNEIQEKKIDRYLQNLEAFRTNIDSLASDSFFLYIPTDTADLQAHLGQLRLIGAETRNTDSSLNAVLKAVRSLKTRSTIISGNVSSKLEEIESFRAQLSQNSLVKETSYLWQAPNFRRPFIEIFRFSIEKTNLVILFYIRNHIGKVLLLLMIFCGLGLYLRSLRHNIYKEMGVATSSVKSLVLQHPLQSCLFITISIGQFIFPTPPFSFYAIAWSINSILLFLILRNHIDAYWLKFWIASVILSMAACGINLILQASRPERVIMLLLSLAGTIAGVIVLRSPHLHLLKEKRLPVFLWIAIAMEAIASVANIYGRYNFAKGLMTTGFFGFVVGIQLLWTVKLIKEIFDISAKSYQDDEKSKFYIDFDKVGSEVPKFLYIILGIGWFVLISQNFYIYTKITDPILAFFNDTRQLGSYSFSLSGILLFIGIIFMSGIVSKLVSYFADNRKRASGSKKSGLDNWMLLIRITIFSVGLFVAFAASGIPMDRIAIVFGALSVGIGFGLQTLVNNLVSGLIIAFEKPIGVGDVVEIGGRSGTMKSIGFRSSVVTTFDGSEVIIPNGDLLNQHLINWTLNDNPRRVEIIVGVNYDTNLDHAIQLIHQVMAGDDRIRKFPESFVLVNNFGNSSIDLRILFWVSHFTNWNLVRSDLMRNIKRTFNDHNIEIPYPQMVVHKADEGDKPSEEENPQ